MNFVKRIGCFGLIFINVALHSSEKPTQPSVLRKNPPLYTKKALSNSSPYFKYHPDLTGSRILPISESVLPDTVSPRKVSWANGLVTDVHFVQTFYEQEKEPKASFLSLLCCCRRANQVLSVTS